MVDYSRFEHIGDDASDDEVRPEPRVTRLSEGSKVVIGKDGWQVAAESPRRRGIDYSRWDNLDESVESEEEKTYYEDEYLAMREDEEKAAVEQEGPRESWMTHRTRQPEWIVDGGVGRRPDGRALFAWSQTAVEVTLRFAVDVAKASEVRLRVWFDRRARRSRLLLGDFVATLKYDVWAEGDDRPHFRLVDGEDDAKDLRDLDWELEDAPVDVLPDAAKCVTLTLRKRPPAREVIVWWSRVFEQSDNVIETELDTASLKSRLSRSTNNSQQIQALQDAWDSAHRAFLTKVRDQATRPTVDVDSKSEQVSHIHTEAKSSEPKGGV